MNLIIDILVLLRNHGRDDDFQRRRMGKARDVHTQSDFAYGLLGTS